MTALLVWFDLTALYDRRRRWFGLLWTKARDDRRCWLKMIVAVGLVCLTALYDRRCWFDLLTIKHVMLLVWFALDGVV
ncbi:hypothetical protein HAX54_032348 [Datura stramonium]|uniref:Uncharacterized protein n=1 Tax=Datura stramonium TaxID=4076 RepID=A0ABS8VDD6_DATST|nr:hypothetical protein [Datura stramonium]